MRASFLLLLLFPIHGPEEALMFQQRFLSQELNIHTFMFLHMLNTNQTPPPQRGSYQHLKGETDLRLRIGLRIH